MHKSVLFLFVVASLFISTSYATQSSIRPGLWEITTNSNLLQLVAQIPPDQMQNLIDLAEQNGFEIPKIQNGLASSNTCILQKMATQKNVPYFLPNQFECSSKNASRKENNYKFNFVCNSEELKGKGSVEGTFTSEENFSGHTTFNGIAQGFPINEQAEINGRWINSDCGTVKPLEY